MRKTLSPLFSTVSLTLLLMLLSFSFYGQVGIGNTNPNSNALLEVGDGTDTGGVLLPRADPPRGPALQNKYAQHPPGLKVSRACGQRSPHPAYCPGSYPHHSRTSPRRMS